MASEYCSSCGNELEPDATFCSSCGATVEGDGTGNEAENGTSAATSGTTEAGSTGATADGSETMFKVTAALVGGYFLFVFVGLGASVPALAGVGVLCMLVSLVTMYVDLRDLDGKLWDTRPILWVIGAALLYIVVGPLYVYKRRQID